MRNITSNLNYDRDHTIIKSQYFVHTTPSDIKRILSEYQRENGFSGYEYWIPSDIPCMNVITSIRHREDENLYSTEVSVIHYSGDDSIHSIPIQQYSTISGEGQELLYGKLGLFNEWILIEDIIKYRGIINNMRLSSVI